MIDHQRQISIPATVAIIPVFVIAVVSYSLAYNAADVMDNDNLATALESQIQISMALIGMVRKLSMDLIVLAKPWGIPLRKLRRLSKPQNREGLGLCSLLGYCLGPSIGVGLAIKAKILTKNGQMLHGSTY